MPAAGSRHHRWNTGRIISHHGYVRVRVGKTHPLADRNGYAYEHLVVWISAGNPKPRPGELLHHRNEDKQDNRYDNLELKTRSGHGQLHVAAVRRDECGRFARRAA